MRAQAAFETLVLVLVIMSAAAGISAIYIQTHNDTIAISMAKEEVLNQLATKDKLVTIDYIRIEKSITDKNMIIKLTPKTTLDISKIQQKISSAVNYNANIVLK
jgi:hypothetical protein